MVHIAADVTPEELQVFLQDADEQLQLLDEDIIKLENGEDNEELLGEVFRAAHTIKGSSAMLGYNQMADLTHAMENILDKLRKGTLSVTTAIADALLHSLDALRVLRENLTAQEEKEIDVTSIIATLDKLANAEAASEDTADAGEAAIEPVAMPLSEKARNRLWESLATGYRAYQLGADINRESAWGAVRCFQILGDLEEKGVVIASNPSREDIEAEKVEFHIELVFAGMQEANEIKEVLDSIPDVENVRVLPYDPGEYALPKDWGGAQAASNESGQATANAVAEALAKVRAQADLRPLSGGATSQETVKMSETVRIDVERLDSLMNMIGEMVVARTRMNQIGRALEIKYKDDPDVVDLCKTFTHITKVVDELQLDITTARMLPVGTVFNRFPRMVRDLAQKAGKKIEFVITGQETGIDRSVIEHIRDPLVHLLRNSVDHGVEFPEKRRAAGKLEKATVRLSAVHEQNYIVISVEDDGKGIDGAMLKEVAVEKGIIGADAAGRMSDADAIDMIFEPGMSTAKQTTEVSGRGVGMDIVRKNIEAFNGTINVETRIGEGTKFSLKLPLTLATFQGLLVSSVDTIYALPLVSIVETLRLEPKEIDTVNQREVFRLRDRILPLLRLNVVLGVSADRDDRYEKVHVVVVKSGERMVGLAVDSLMEPQEVVVKTLGTFIGDVKGIAGASILGSGDVALILDVPSLVKLAVMGE